MGAWLRHTVHTAQSKGWDKLSNGALLDAAEEAGLELLLTTDRRIRPPAKPESTPKSRVQSPESRVRSQRVQRLDSGRRLASGMPLAAPMRAKKLEDLLVYQKSLEGVVEVSALLKHTRLRKDFDLADQLSESSGRIPGHIGEGYGQLTDRHFAKYLGIARGSAKETCAHLAVAFTKGHISKEEHVHVSGIYDDLADMLSSLIDYLRRSDWNDRW
jgi:four helix bundle protein